jgi:endo-1,4-beta-xylanase
MRVLSLVATVTAGLLAPSFAPSFGQDAPKKAERPTATAIYGTPKIDGEIDDAWKGVTAVEVKRVVKSETSMAESEVATGSVKLMWDKDFLYALWQVKDSKLSGKSDNAYEQDSIEFFVDELNERAGAYQKDDAQYRVSFEGKLSGAGDGYKEENLKASVKKIEGGYVVEMSVKLSFAKREGGTKMGLELQINDDPNTGSRGGVTKWNHAENDSYQSTSNFGEVLLKPKSE